MQVEYKVFFDGQRKPQVKKESGLKAVLESYVELQDREAIIQDLAKGKLVDYKNRYRGFHVVIKNLALGVKIERTAEIHGFIRVELSGIKTIPQIKVAAADALKGEKGWHRTVVLVKANGLLYKVKCHHKGLTYTECVNRCTIESKKAA